MNKLDFFGHFFYASLFLGMLLLSAKDYRGWAFRFAGEAGWIGIGIAMGMSSIIFWGLAFMAVDAWGYLKWSSEQEILAMEERLEDLDDVWAEEEPLWSGFISEVTVKETKNVKQKLPRRVRTGTSKPKAKAKKAKANGKKRQRKTSNPEAKSRRSTSRAKKMPKVQRKVRKASRNTR